MYSPARRPEMPWWHCCIVVGALWLLARPYGGLAHDGILYLAQALNHLRQGSLAEDLFLAYGSQDRFTVFARLLAHLYARFELATVQMATLTICHAALLVAAWLLLSPLSSRRRWLGLCALAVVSHQYGGHAIFAFAERFVSARTLAEPLALGALWAVVAGRRVLGVALLLFAGLVHPLVALTVAVVGWCWLCLGDRRWCWLALAAPLPFVAGALSIVPFDGLLRPYDDTWWAAVEGVSRHVLISTWSLIDWSVLALDAGLLWLASRWFAAPVSRLCLATLIATGALVIVGFIGADLLRNQLLTQLQVWRVLWIDHLLAIALAPALVVHSWGRGARGRALAYCMAASVVAVTARWEAGWAFAAITGLAYAVLDRELPLSPTLERWWPRATAAALIGVSFAVVANSAHVLQDGGALLGADQIVRLAVTMPLLSITAAAALLEEASRGVVYRIVAAAGLAAMAAFAVARWDQRAPMVRAIEDGLHREHPFRQHLPPGVQVLWWKFPAASWVLLQRPNYWSPAQGAGLLFHRATATEFQRRAAMFGLLELQHTVCMASAALNGQSSQSIAQCMPTREAMQRICHQERGPAFLVFERQMPEALARWDVDEGQSIRSWHLYDCADFR